MLPLSFDLAMEIAKFRRLMEEKFNHNRTKKEIIKFVNVYLSVDENAAEAIFQYFQEQFQYAEIAHAAVFLAMAESAYITGHTLHVNGGMYMS